MADGMGQWRAIGDGDLARHVYVVGATGTGKSTLLASMIRQDVAAGRGIMLIDPHGDLFAEIRDHLPHEIMRRALLADAGDLINPFALNLLAIEDDHTGMQRNFVCNQLIHMFKRLLYADCPEAFGPMFEAYFRNALMLLMDAEGPQANLADFERIFGDRTWRQRLLTKCGDPAVLRFWTEIAGHAGGEAKLENIAPYICSKLTQLTGNPVLRPILAAASPGLDLPGALAEGRVVLCNLAKGRIGGPDAALLGGILTIRLFAAAMARSSLPPGERTSFRLYLDEFQTYASDTLGQMLAECRKFGLELVLANQSIGQVDGRGADIGHAILANVGSLLAFRVGPMDARLLADWFAPDVSGRALARQPDRTFTARILHDGVPCAPMQLRTVDADMTGHVGPLPAKR